MVRTFRLLLLSLSLFAAAPASAFRLPDAVAPNFGFEALGERGFCKHVLKGELFSRTELFFGLNRPGGVVTEAEFQRFVDTAVTPRFPDGLTIVSAKGQFRGANNAVEREDAKVLILLYPFTDPSNAKVEKIRSEYKTAFEQQSVLRVDEQSCTSF
jgi:Protein of unknown function (DUF3574)